VIEKDRVPASLIAPCGKGWRKPGAAPNARAGGADTVDDLYTRGDTNEARLDTCGTQVSKIAEWDKQ
jgi:hypothetical protein